MQLGDQVVQIFSFSFVDATGGSNMSFCFHVFPIVIVWIFLLFVYENENARDAPKVFPTISHEFIVANDMHFHVISQLINSIFMGF
jgi:hypothetical protein